MNTPEETHHVEQVLWTGKRSQWFFLGHWLVGLLIVAGLAAGIYYKSALLQPWMPWVWAAPVVALLIVIGYIEFVRGYRRYRITTLRVIAESGRVVRDSNELRIDHIQSINVLKAGIPGFIGIGRVEFSSAATDDADVTFYQISGVDSVRDLVRKLQP